MTQCHLVVILGFFLKGKMMYVDRIVAVLLLALI